MCRGLRGNLVFRISLLKQYDLGISFTDKIKQNEINSSLFMFGMSVMEQLAEAT